MRPDLILDEDGKKKRFRKQNKSIEVSNIEIMNHNSDEDEVQIFEYFQKDIKGKNSNQGAIEKNYKQHLKIRHTMPYFENNSFYQNLYSSNTNTASVLPPWPKYDDEQSENGFPPFSPPGLIGDNSKDFHPNEIFLDPETELTNESPLSYEVKESSPHYYPIQYFSPQNTISPISNHSYTLTEDDVIMDYIHKKFRKHDNKNISTHSQDLDEHHVIKNITIQQYSSNHHNGLKQIR